MSLRPTALSELETIVNRINESYLIARKSFELLDGSGQMPLTLTPEVMRIADQFLKNHNIDTTVLENKDIKLSEEEKELIGWEIFWAQEMAAAMTAIPNRGSMYQMYLPGRFLHYDLLAHNIASLFNGGSDSIEGKKVAEIGSGSGLGLMKVAQKCASVVGLDYSVMAIEFAKYLSRHYNVEGKTTLVHGGYFDMPPEFLEKAPFDVVYNSGVLEHERRAAELVGQMAKITRPGGYVVIAVPNESGVFYRRFKDRERTVKDRFKQLIRIPVEHRRYGHNIQKLMEDNGLRVIREDGVQIAPSAPIIKKEDILERDVRTFAENLPRDKPQSIEHAVNAWSIFEIYATRDFRLRYGWSRYYLGQKPNPQPTNQ